MTSRRRFLAGLVATGLAPTPTWADAGGPAFLSAAVDASGDYLLIGLGADGSERFRLPLPTRGHAASAHPTRPQAVCFARRPGTFAIVLDCRSGTAVAHLESPPGRHFYGHGAFDPSGDLLMTTENDYDAGEGRIGLWDVRRNYARIGDIPSHGIGPHDIRQLPQGGFVVANGGIDTHPDSGRTKLNIPTMQPNLSYLDPDGALVDQVLPPDRLSSIRHLAVRSDGLVAVGMQWQGDISDSPPMIGLHRPGDDWAVLGDADILAGYVGSIAFSTDGTAVGATSSDTGRVQFLSVSDVTSVDHHIAGVSGIASGPGGFVCTTADGRLYAGPPAGLTEIGAAPVGFDNHLIPI